MNDFLKRLTSRKFLLSVAGIITLVANHQYTQAAVLGLGYLVTEGVIDARAVTTTSTIEAKAHALAAQLLDELSQLPPAQADDPRQGLPLKNDRPKMTEPARPSPTGRTSKRTPRGRS